MNIVIDNVLHALMITLFVFVMMLLVDYFNVITQGRLSKLLKAGRWRQYWISSFLGSTPGCLGAYLNVSFYVHGLISFGAIVGGMIATSGDEAFVMLSLFPEKAILLFGLLFVLGIVFAWVTDQIIRLFHFKPCLECNLQVVHSVEDCECFDRTVLAENFLNISFRRLFLLGAALVFLILLVLGVIGPAVWNWKKVAMVSLIATAIAVIGSAPEHYLQEHIWQHLVKKHVIRVFLWTVSALLFVNIGLQFVDLDTLIRNHLNIVLLLAVLLGIIPESGPHLILVMLFAKGSIPFSILVASSIVQDGHGMLPLLSYTVRDSLVIKAFNVLYGLGIGLIMLALGW